MLTRYVLLGGLLMPSGALLAQAQTAPAVSVPLALPTFAAAHDTLVRRAGRVRAVAEAHAGYFDYRMGSLGGLHRTVKTYALPGRVSCQPYRRALRGQRSEAAGCQIPL